MNLELLPVLKDKLLHAKQLSEVTTYFFDHFGEDPEFIALGELVRHPFLEAVIGEIGRQMFGKETPPTDLLLTRLADQQFIHGGGAVNGRVISLLFFEDVSVGLLALAASIDPPETKFARFTGKCMAPPPGLERPSAN